MKPPLGQRLRTLIGREHRAALVARWFPRRIDKLLLAAIAVVIIAGTVLRIGVIGTNNRVSSDEYGVAQNANEILAELAIEPLDTPSGMMGGSYEMESESGERFHIEIPTFSLDSPGQGMVVN